MLHAKIIECFVKPIQQIGNLDGRESAGNDSKVDDIREVDGHTFVAFWFHRAACSQCIRNVWRKAIVKDLGLCPRTDGGELCRTQHLDVQVNVFGSGSFFGNTVPALFHQERSFFGARRGDFGSLIN